MERIKEWIKKQIANNYALQLLFWYMLFLFLIYKVSQWIF
jgi:hypothetical protein